MSGRCGRIALQDFANSWVHRVADATVSDGGAGRPSSALCRGGAGSRLRSAKKVSWAMPQGASALSRAINITVTTLHQATARVLTFHGNVGSGRVRKTEELFII